MTRRIALFITVIMLITTSICGMPLKPGIYDAETGLSRITGLPVRIDRPKGVDAPEPRRVAKVSGNYKCLILLIEYPDQGATQTTTSFSDMFNLAGYNGTGSINDYYREISYGNFGVSGTVGVGSWYTSSNNRAYYGYGNGFARAAELVREAVDLANAAGVDFAPYDNDGDGMVDSLFVVHSGKGYESTYDSNDIWSHKWSLSDAGVGARNYDGVTIDVYAIQPELNGAGNHIEIGVFCHEYGHILGLPDLYDTDYSSAGIGVFCLMSSGSWGGNTNSPQTPTHMCAWAKNYLGWLTPTIINRDTTNQAIKQIETNAEAYKLWTDGNPQKEYFLVSNRAKTGFDANLPGNGLLIWHIDENVINANMSTNTVNNDETHKGVDLEEADGLNNLDNDVNSGDAGDYFNSTNNSAFNDSSNPNSRSYAGNNTKVAVTNISAPGSVMYTNLYVSATWVFGIRKAYNYPNPFVLHSGQTTIRIELGLEVSINDIDIEIYDIAGELVHRVESSDIRQSGRIYEYYWDGKNDQGREVGSGVYIYRIRVEGDDKEEVFYGKLAVVR